MAALDEFDKVLEGNMQPEFYKCRNRADFALGYFAPNRVYHADGTWSMNQLFILNTFSTDCATGNAGGEPRCGDCRFIKKVVQP